MLKKDALKILFVRKISPLKRQDLAVLYFVLGRWCNKNKINPCKLLQKKKIAGVEQKLFSAILNGS